MSFRDRKWASTLLCAGISLLTAAGELRYKPAPVDNPLKGLVPYISSDQKNRFPHSMEFRYFPMHKIMTDPDRFDWTIIEEAAGKTQAKGCQLIFRIYLEYPGKGLCTPQFLVTQGVKITKWQGDDGISHTPDYSDQRIRSAMKRFIQAMGDQYDGDPRIGFITAGFLGSWGEWHIYPRDDLWASKTVQSEILDAYEAAFSITPILLRYPAKEDDWDQAANAKRAFGYHDDSFEWATLHTGKSKDDWFFESKIRTAGAEDKWKRFPIGGEIRPELWRKSFTDKPHKRSQGFDICVERTHATWLMDTGLFQKKYPMDDSRKQHAESSVRKMGYEYHLASWQANRGDKKIEVEMTIKNRGVAPFYYNWPVEFACTKDALLPSTLTRDLRLKGILPGAPMSWRIELPLEWSGGKIRVRVPNPMKGGRPLRFANQSTNNEWTVLGILP